MKLVEIGRLAKLGFTRGGDMDGGLEEGLTAAANPGG